jgi:probable rRNA maturation factor
VTKPAVRLRLSVDVQKQCRGWNDIMRVTALVRKAAIQTIALSGIPVMPGAEVAIALADDATVRRANKAWRQMDKPTNVLSFPSAPPDKIGKAAYLGDVILAYETVVQEARDEEKPLANHLSHLIIHAMLHLLGHDHMTSNDAERMEKLETLILASLGIPDPYSDSDPLETHTA